MAGFKRTISIQRPVGEVFDFATDLKNAPVLLPSISKTEMLTEGGMKAGARFRETRLMNGKEQASVIEITQHRRPEVHAASSAMLGMKATYTFRFVVEGTGTRVDMDADVKGMLLWWPFLGMLARIMEREDGDYLVRLKAALEASKSG